MSDAATASLEPRRHNTLFIRQRYGVHIGLKIFTPVTARYAIHMFYIWRQYHIRPSQTIPPRLRKWILVNTADNGHWLFYHVATTSLLNGYRPSLLIITGTWFIVANTGHHGHRFPVVIVTRVPVIVTIVTYTVVVTAILLSSRH